RCTRWRAAPGARARSMPAWRRWASTALRGRRTWTRNSTSSCATPSTGPTPRRPSAKCRPPERGSLDGDALGQIARLVDAAAPPQRDVVGQQLPRDRAAQRLQILRHVRHRDDLVGTLGHLVVALTGNGDDGPTAGLDLLEVAHDLVVNRTVGHEEDAG